MGDGEVFVGCLVCSVVGLLVWFIVLLVLICWFVVIPLLCSLLFSYLFFLLHFDLF